MEKQMTYSSLVMNDVPDICKLKQRIITKISVKMAGPG